MPPALKPCFRLLRASYAGQTRYLSAALGGLIANTTFAFLKAAVLFATVEAAGGTVAGYSIGEMATYNWLSQGLFGAVALHGAAEIGDRIRSGDIAVDFARPLDLQTAQLATDLGERFFALSTRFLPIVAIGAVTTGLALPSGALPYLLGAVSLLLGMILSFCGRYALNTAGFWVVETRGFRILYMLVATFLAGMYVPISLFPEWLHTLSLLTPFPAILMTPIDVLSGRLEGTAALSAIGIQLLWIVGIGGLGRLLTQRGRVRYEVQGG